MRPLALAALGLFGRVCAAAGVPSASPSLSPSLVQAPSAYPQAQPTSSPIWESPYCNSNGEYSTMAHYGFQNFGNPSDECILWLFTDAVLDTQPKYIGAVVGTFFLAGTVDAMNFARLQLGKKIKFPLLHRGFDFFVYAATQLVAWAVMLIGMSYSTGLFLAVVLGLTAGHFCFFANDGEGDKQEMVGLKGNSA